MKTGKLKGQFLQFSADLKTNSGNPLNNLLLKVTTKNSFKILKKLLSIFDVQNFLFQIVKKNFVKFKYFCQNFVIRHNYENTVFVFFTCEIKIVI